jgi:hypothetical protein
MSINLSPNPEKAVPKRTAFLFSFFPPFLSVAPHFLARPSRKYLTKNRGGKMVLTKHFNELGENIMTILDKIKEAKHHIQLKALQAGLLINPPRAIRMDKKVNSPDNTPHSTSVAVDDKTKKLSQEEKISQDFQTLKEAFTTGEFDEVLETFDDKTLVAIAKRYPNELYEAAKDSVSNEYGIATISMEAAVKINRDLQEDYLETIKNHFSKPTIIASGKIKAEKDNQVTSEKQSKVLFPISKGPRE